MKRDCELIVSNKDGKRAIFIDTENKNEILEYLFRTDKHKKKFTYIAKHILEGVEIQKSMIKRTSMINVRM